MLPLCPLSLPSVCLLSSVRPQEYCEDCPDKSRIVQRSPQYADNALLPGRFTTLMGAHVLDGLVNGFQEEVFGAPAPLNPTASRQQLLASLQDLVNVLLAAGYALKVIS